MMASWNNEATSSRIRNSLISAVAPFAGASFKSQSCSFVQLMRTAADFPQRYVNVPTQLPMPQKLNPHSFVVKYVYPNRPSQNDLRTKKPALIQRAALAAAFCSGVGCGDASTSKPQSPAIQPPANSISRADSTRHWPGGKSPSQKFPMRTRINRSVGWPMAAVIRRTWRFLPSTSSNPIQQSGTDLRKRMGGLRGGIKVGQASRLPTSAKPTNCPR